MLLRYSTQTQRVIVRIFQECSSVQVGYSRNILLKTNYEENLVDKFKSILLLMIFRLNIINYNS